ncbi:MAG: hypothetical protein MUE53_02885 [Chitinophagales bacterium]|nr:hypothetical protein [Chitinophagales bacterium]
MKQLSYIVLGLILSWHVPEVFAANLDSLTKLGQYNEAISLIKNDPNLDIADKYYNYALVLQTSRQTAQARLYLLKAIKIKPHNQKFKDNLDIINAKLKIESNSDFFSKIKSVLFHTFSLVHLRVISLCIALVWLISIFMRKHPKFSVLYRFEGILLFCLAISLLWMWAQIYQSKARKAMIRYDQIIKKSTPKEKVTQLSQTHYNIVTVIDSLDDLYLVETDEQKNFWTEKKNLDWI